MSPTKLCVSFLLTTFEIVLQLSGLWPFRFDHQTKYFRRSTTLTVYSLCVCPIVMLIMVYYASWGIGSHQQVLVQHVGRINGGIMIVSMLVLAITMSLTYVAQHCHSGKLTTLVVDAMHLMLEIGKIPSAATKAPPLSYRHTLVLFVVKSLVLNILLVLSMIYHCSVIAPNFLSDPIFILAWMLPHVLLAILPETFYGLMLILCHYYRLLNERLREIEAELRSLRGGHRQKPDSNNDTTRISLGMHVCCDLSDRMDHLAAMHQRLTCVVQRLNDAMAVQLLLWTLYSMLILVAKMFLEYLAISMTLHASNDGDDDRLREFALNMVSLLTTFGSMVLMADACSATTNEAAQSSKILHYVFLTPQVDVRLKRSVRTCVLLRIS